MTREEQILNAAREYNNGIIFSNPSNVLHFEAGAKWADEHPKFENAWHDAYEEPEIGSNIIVIDKKGQWWDIKPYDGDYNGYGGLTGWRCCVVHYNIQHWAYMSDLRPKTN